MDDPHYAHAYVADDFATYALPESPSSLHSSFSHDSTVFMPAPLPPKPSPRHRNLSLGKPGFPAAPQKQWPPHGFKAPTLQTADPMDELSDSMSPETDWLSPASRSSNMDEYTNVPTGRWGGRSATEGGVRQWQGSPRTSPRGEKMSPRTYKLQMQAAERFEDEARGNPLARVNEGYVLGSDQEVQAKWQRYQQEEQKKRRQAAEAGRIRGQEEEADGQAPRAEFRRYARPAERTWYSQGMETEEQRQAEDVRQERWQQLKEHEADRQRQLAAQRVAVTSPAPEVRPAARMVKQECWARTDGDMLVRKQCWVEEAAPAVCIQVVEHQILPPQRVPTPPPPQWQPPAQPRADSWHEDDHNSPGTSGRAQQYGSESYTRSRVSRQDWVEGWGHQEQRFERRAERRRGPDRPYDSDRPHSSSSAQHENTERGHYSSSEASSVATFPRSERERAEWEARGRGERSARQSAQRGGEFQRGAQAGGQETRVGEWAQAAAFSETKAQPSQEQEIEDGGPVQEGGMTVAARWSERTSRELQFGERPESRGHDASLCDTPRAVTLIEERVSEVGLVDGGENIWVEERTVTHKETVADVIADASGEGADVTSPTLVAEAVSRLALTSVGWDEAMHNFHDLRGVRAVVKKPEELLSPAVVSGAVTLSGLARKRAISLPATEGAASRVLGTSGLGVSHHSRGHSADEGSRGGAPFVSEIAAEKANRTDLDAAKESQTDLDTWEVVRAESSNEERPALRQNDDTVIATGARPASAQNRDRLAAPAAGADVSNDGDARRADDLSRNGRDDRGWARCFPHPPEARRVSPSVAAIISPPAVSRGASPVPLNRSDSYPPSERPPGKSSPVWSTTITSVPILSAPPMVQAASTFRPAVTLPPRFPPLPLLTEMAPHTPAMVPHPPSNPSPRPHLRRASRSGALSVEERRPPVSPESAFPQYDSEPVPKQSWRGAEFPETLSERKGDRSGNEESWGVSRKDDSTPRRDDGNPGQLSRFAPPFRGGPPAHPAPPGRVEGAAGGQGSSQMVVEVDCPICSEPLQVGRAMFAPECGHFVHFDCCRSNLLKGSLDCPRCHQRMQQKPYLKTPYGRPDADRRRVTIT